MTLNLTPLEELVTTDTTTQRRTTMPELDANLLAPEVAIPEDVEMPEPDDSAPVTPDQFLGGAVVPQTALEERRSRIEDAIGESVRVQGRSSELSAALRDGVVVNVTVGHWRGKQRNTAADIGLNEFVVARMMGGCGVRLLAPKEILNRLASLDTQVRQSLNRFALKTPWGRFIPRRNWDRFKSLFDSLQTEFFHTIESLVAKVEDGTLNDWVREVYTDFAKETWPKVRANWTPDPSMFEPGHFAAPENGYEYDAYAEAPPEAYVERIVSNAIAKIPSPGYIRDAAKFDYDLSIVHAPDTMLASEYVSEDEDLQRELLRHMNERKRTLIDDFLRTARETLLENVQGLVEAVTNTLEGKSAVHGKTINKILSKLEDVRYLNVINDQDFEQRIRELEEFVTEKRDARTRSTTIDPQVILRQLNSTASSITENLNRQLSTQQQFAQIGEF